MNMSLCQLTIGDFLDRLASDAPTPGGGSAAALAGAVAAALGRMVCALTVGKAKFAAVEPEIRALAQRLARADGMLRQFIDEDAAAYEVLCEAFKVDRSDPRRAERVSTAATLAATVPLETAALCAELVRDLNRLAAIGNPLLRSDVAAALHLAQAAMRAAAANVRANLPWIAADDAQQMENQLLVITHGRRRKKSEKRDGQA
jgi:formiminotetrahydrofolate cyclodeaminase